MPLVRADRTLRAPQLSERTLDVRTNHRLHFPVWKRLLARQGARAVPDRVCVGGRGARVDDFRSELELENARHRGGGIAVDPDGDAAAVAG